MSIKSFKVHAASDYHIDIMERQRLREGKEPLSFKIPEEADLVILAGDVAEGLEGIEWASKINKPVIYVPGNHEYYWHVIDTLDQQMREAAGETDNIVFLNNDRHDIDNIRILGSVLWTDYSLEGDAFWAMKAAKAMMSDHQVIRVPGEPGGIAPTFSPKDARAVHMASRAWLETELAKPHDGPTVVVTHHAPHMLLSLIHI